MIRTATPAAAEALAQLDASALTPPRHPEPEAREVHHDLAQRGIAPPDPDLVHRREHELAGDRVEAVVVGHDRNRVAGPEAVRLARVGGALRCRPALLGDRERLRGRHLDALAVAEGVDAVAPRAHVAG